MLEKLKGLLKDHFDNVIKLVIALSLVCIANGVNASTFSGSVGIGSDYVFRGISQHEGNHVLSASIDADIIGGVYASAWVSEVDFGDGKAEHEIDTVVGLKKDWKHVGFNVAYIDYGYRGNSSLDYEEILISATLAGVTVAHYMGQDEASDYTEFSTGLLKVVDMAYGDAEGQGTHWAISKSFDALKGTVKVGYTDFTADDASGLLDEDNLFVNYVYTF